MPIAEPNAATDGKDGPVGPNMNQGEHVSEEAAKMAKITGGEGPDMDVGTPVQDILAGDKEAQKDMPEVMKESIKSGQGAQNAKPDVSGKRTFSTYARRRLEMQTITDPAPLPIEASMRSSSAQDNDMSPSTTAPQKLGHKFPLPELPLHPRLGKDYRYDPVVSQITNLIMQHGMKATAQRNMAHILTVLRTAPAPTYNPNRPLLPGAPPASHLPLNPVLYLTLAVDSVAPLLRIRSQRGAAGGGVALQIPVPLGLRQRRRQSMMWILDAVEKKKSRGSGRTMFPQRIAEELIAIVEGRSAVWDRRGAVHKLGTTARSNLTFGRRR